MAVNNLRSILINEGITQAELCRSSGMNATTINKCVNQKRTLSPVSNGKIVKALNKLSGKEYQIVDVFPPKSKN